VLRNECSFMKISQSVVSDNDATRHEPGPATGVSTSSSSEGLRAFDNEQSNWMPIGDHLPVEHGQDVQRTLQGLAIGTNSLKQNVYSSGDLANTGYRTNENSTTQDTGLSPDTAHSGSNRPTPNSTTPSESRSNLHPGSNSSAPSYETSPVSSHQACQPPQQTRSMNSFFSTQPDYSGISATGYTPDNTFSLPDTPGKDFTLPSEWEMTQQQSTGLTPVGEGVFRQLMGLGPMDSMDIGWEGGS